MPAEPIGQEIAVGHAGPPDLGRWRLRATAHPHGDVIGGQLGHGRGVGRHDDVEAQAEPGQHGDRPVEVVAPQLERLGHRPNGSEARDDLR